MKRVTALFVLAILATACGREDPNRFTLQNKKVERVEGCHLYMDSWNALEEPYHAGLEFVCGVEAAAQNEKEWWGSQPQPLAFDMRVGECLLLGDKFYCLEKVAPGEATFKATYQWANRHHDHIKPLP